MTEKTQPPEPAKPKPIKLEWINYFDETTGQSRWALRDPGNWLTPQWRYNYRR